MRADLGRGETLERAANREARNLSEAQVSATLAGPVCLLTPAVFMANNGVGHVYYKCDARVWLLGFQSVDSLLGPTFSVCKCSGND